MTVRLPYRIRYIYQVLTSTEGQHTSPEVARVEGDIDTGKRNGGKATIELDVSLSFLLILCLGKARLNNLRQHLLDFLDGEALRELERLC